MTYEKMKAGILIGFIGIILALVVLALFVPITTIIFALLIGLLFALPVSALVLILIGGASTLSKKPKKASKSEREDVVISTN
ncbi:MAG: hypothetical protein WA130_08285 [Candidatus Methanoperedens sp.]